ncbi:MULTISPECIES: hypothetical protein [Cupriavidus]
MSQAMVSSFIETSQSLSKKKIPDEKILTEANQRFLPRRDGDCPPNDREANLSLDRRLANVERELIRLGLGALAVISEIDDHREWFEGQFAAGDITELTARDRFTHHH